MMRSGSRTITVKKEKLISTIKENKRLHIKEYEDAVIAYKTEALKQLVKLTAEAESGSIGIKLSLITPVNNSKNYDKILSMFDWELKDVVELTQDEFKEYILDETDFTFRAKMSNKTYL